MVARLIWSPEARKDLLEIYIAIGLDNPAAAERLYTMIETKAERIGHLGTINHLSLLSALAGMEMSRGLAGLAS